ncbi:hypothetical protein GCM10009555_013060 [Acrocarpospora macrocephala]|uniref:Uncharacterized protein n=1 Tax=Acrocarpospora macrocephala TaxID=150177 RepID=A0A5M3WG64_9ACTN|nr:hypothetical protein Amac_017100 [Acrocarpospora macrocephala]
MAIGHARARDKPRNASYFGIHAPSHRRTPITVSHAIIAQARSPASRTRAYVRVQMLVAVRTFCSGTPLADV